MTNELPDSLQQAIEETVGALDFRELLKAQEELTKRYRQPTAAPCITTQAQRLTYLLTRLPATYAALHATLEAIKERMDFPIHSLLDLGAGPGTAMWATSEIFPTIDKITLIEKDRALASIGMQLAEKSDSLAIRSAQWLEEDLEKLSSLHPHDLIILSYSIGELHPEKIVSLIELCWRATHKLLLIVEPGTPVGFERIRLIRKQLIDLGAHLVAPCPHHLACPMQGGDWCHFAARVERTTLHRRLKGGTLGYEDEKYSYVAVSKTAVPLPETRILAEPERHSGHVILKLCTEKGVQWPTLSKKRGELYKLARKAKWGDPFPFEHD